MRRPVYDRVLCQAPYAEAARRLAGPPTSWLPAPARQEPGGVVVRMVGPGLGVAVDALVDVGPVAGGSPSTTVRPVAWRARTADRLFPRLVADLELAPVTAQVCELVLVGGYRPPVSVVGDAADRVVGRHVAETVVRSFLEDVVERLAAPPEQRAEVLASGA